jgi:orotate phosphoribosyltransferase
MDQNPLQNRINHVIRLVRQLSYREGEFTLSSGKKSSFYIDLKATTLHPEGAFWIGMAAVELLKTRDWNIQGVGGLTLGADPLATAISLAARACDLHWPAFIVRKEPKAHGTSSYIEGTENLPKNAQVLVLEDVITTGKSSLIAIEKLREAGYRPLATLAVVDREDGGREALQQHGMELISLMTLKDVQALKI